MIRKLAACAFVLTLLNSLACSQAYGPCGPNGCMEPSNATASLTPTARTPAPVDAAPSSVSSYNDLPW